MGDRLDDLFSPERHRGRWTPDAPGAPSVPEPPERPVAASPEEKPDLFATVERIGAFIRQRYPGDRGTPLANLLSEMDALLRLRFPEPGEAEVSPDERDALNFAIEERIIDMEDLTEAMEMEQRGGR